ncbi:MAG: hypothetical protein ACYCS8_18790 [Acidithiobacillus sp.]
MGTLFSPALAARRRFIRITMHNINAYNTVYGFDAFGHWIVVKVTPQWSTK